MEEVQAIASRVAIMDQGHVIAQGTVDELVERIQYEERVTVEVGVPAGAAGGAQAITGVKEVSRKEARLMHRFPGGLGEPGPGDRLRAEGGGRALRCRRRSPRWRTCFSP